MREQHQAIARLHTLAAHDRELVVGPSPSAERGDDGQGDEQFNQAKTERDFFHSSSVFQDSQRPVLRGSASLCHIACCTTKLAGLTPFASTVMR